MNSQKDNKINESEFISLAVHRLQTPLAAIAWYAEMLLTEEMDNISESQKEYIEKIIASNRQMMELVGGLLSASAYDQGNLAVEMVPTDVIQIAENVIGGFNALIAKRGISIGVEYGEMPVIEGDPKLLEVIFENIISNAIKYSNDGDEIKIVIEIEGGKMVFSCADKGIGIPKEQQQNLFTKLFRADNAKQAEISGVGLGLYIAKKCVDRLDGNIEVESREGEGCTFIVKIPFKVLK